MTTNNQVKKKRVVENLFDLLQRKPEKHDVTFVVGQKKTKVKGLQIMLEAASPVFESKFENQWKERSRKGKQICLPDVDPVAFWQFLQLIILDDWSVSYLSEIVTKLDCNEMLKLRSLCEEYQMEEEMQNVEKVIVESPQFQKTFHHFLHGYEDEFMKLSSSNLKILVSSDWVQLSEFKIYEFVLKWAEIRCQKENIVESWSNKRKFLDDLIFEIRFPLIPKSSLKKVLPACNNILSFKEHEDLAAYLKLDKIQRMKFCRERNFPFRTQKRTKLPSPKLSSSSNLFPGCILLDLIEKIEIDKSTPFICNGEMHYQYLQSKTLAFMQGLAFVGPVEDEDHDKESYKVSVIIEKYVDGKSVFSTSPMTKTVPFQKCKTIDFDFCKPVHIQPTQFGKINDLVTSYYRIGYSLKGRATSSIPYLGRTFYPCIGKHKFCLHSSSNQLAGIYFKIPGRLAAKNS